MYTLHQLLIRNFLFLLCFSALVSVISAAFLSLQINDLQQEHSQTLQTIANDATPESFTQSVQALSKTGIYHALNVEHDGNVLVTSTSASTSPLLNLLLPKENTITVAKVTVKYQLNVQKSIELLIRIVISVFGLGMIFIILASYFSVTRYKRLAGKINDQIKRDLALIISEQEVEDDSPDNEIDLPEVQAHLDELKTFLRNQIVNTHRLESDAYIEPVTKLENRNRFVQFFENTESRSDFGVLSITRCSELQTINQIHGYNEGDAYICKVADIMKNVVTRFKGAQLYRLNSSDFATLIPNITLKSAESFANELQGQFNQYQQASDLDSVAYTGLVYFDKDKPLGELLALADTGISIAQTQHVNAWFSQTDNSILESTSANFGNQNWRQEIENILENQRINLLLQPIKPSSPNNRVYGEILARFVSSNDDILPTTSFFAMAEKLDKIVDVDRMVIEAAIKEITSKNMQDHFFGINISSRSINDGHFLIWLERRLLRDAAIASKLVFEITEYGLQQNIKTSKHFVDMIHRTGARVTVERFGVGLTSFKFFRDLKPDFIKMDSTYTRDIDEDKNNQYFLRLMVDLAHRLSISVLAESVESQEEKFTLEKLFIDGCQGFYIGKPKPL